MLVIETKIGKIEVTELENKVIEIIKKCNDYNDYPCAVLKDITDYEISPKVARGVLSSLVKKGIVEISELPNTKVCYLYIADGESY